jgi:PAS domain-containing protein
VQRLGISSGNQFESHSPTGNGILVLSAIRDITDRELVEEQLRRAHEELARQKDRELWENQARLALIVGSSQDAIIGKDLNGIITHGNKARNTSTGTLPQRL